MSCPHLPPCAGCPRFGEPGIERLSLESLQKFSQAQGLAGVEVVDGATSGFRMRARLAIRGRIGTPKLGLFERNTHRVVHIPNCRVHHPLINRAASIVRRAIAESRLTSYSDQAHLGLARYLQVVVERRSQAAQLVLVGNHPTSAPFTDCLGMIKERLAQELHSLWFNPNCTTSNTILGPEFERLYGPVSVVERFGGHAVHYPPGAFGQNNLDIAERIIEHVRGQIPAGARVTEFYAGVGAIGLSVLDRVSQIHLNEVAPASLAGLELGLAALAPADRNKVVVVPGPAGAARSIARQAEVVIVDPPRKGLDPELIQELVEQPPECLIYISCGLPSFFEDAARLTVRAQLRLGNLTAFNLHPFTDHVETVAVFVRS